MESNTPSTPAAVPTAEATNAPADKNTALSEAFKSAQGVDSKADAPSDSENGDAVKEAAAEAMRKYKVKVSGEELEVDEEELKRGYAHKRAAARELQEGKKLQKQAEQLVEMLKDKKSLWQIAEKLGHDPRALAEELLAERLKDEMMDPRDRELRDTKEKLTKYEREQQEIREAKEREMHEGLKAKYAKEYETQFIQALDSTGLPGNKQTVAAMAKYIHEAATQGYKISAEEAAKLVREDIETAQKRLLADLDGEKLVKLLGDDLANKVRKWDTSRLKNPESMLRTPEQQTQTTRREVGKTLSNQDRRKMWREINGR